jgi:hypothetical protein
VWSVWRLTEQHTQAEAARALGWERGQVAKYAMLQKIAPAAWNVVRIDSVPTIQGNGTSEENGDGTTFVPSGTFTEGLLRNILPLRRKQQVELCKGLAARGVPRPSTRCRPSAPSDRIQRTKDDLRSASVSADVSPARNRDTAGKLPFDAFCEGNASRAVHARARAVTGLNSMY